MATKESYDSLQEKVVKQQRLIASQQSKVNDIAERVDKLRKEAEKHPEITGKVTPNACRMHDMISTDLDIQVLAIAQSNVRPMSDEEAERLSSMLVRPAPTPQAMLKIAAVRFSPFLFSLSLSIPSLIDSSI